MGSDADAIIVGGGLAGLTCARQLCAAGLSCQLLEASDRIGGRVRTDEVDGYLLDRGFQVFLTAYPEARATLDYDALQLCPFLPGALVRVGDRFHPLMDPWRRPRDVVSTAMSSAATLTDKWRIAAWRRYAVAGSLAQIYQRPAHSTLDYLRDRGFSDVVIERFLRPFLGGVFLDSRLETSSRMCEFVWRMFAQGDAVLPAHGMGSIPEQIARALPQGVVHTDCPVDAIDGQQVVLASGERRQARWLIVATDARSAAELLGRDPPVGRRVCCLYYTAPTAPVSQPVLILNGNGPQGAAGGPINNLCVPSQVAPAYAPGGRALISATVLECCVPQAELDQQVRGQLRNWFGTSVDEWEHVRSYEIHDALPPQAPPALDPVEQPVVIRDGLLACGDYLDTGSINGAMSAGRRAAEAVLGATRGATPAVG